jgi:phosphoribosylformylglycinamidine synthase
MSQLPLPVYQPVVSEVAEATEAVATAALSVFGSSEYAKVVLGNLWGTPPPLDLEAEARLHLLLAELAGEGLLRSARDISDGGIAVASAQAGFAKGIGATVEQDQSLMVHPLFGLFAEPASTVLVTTHHSNLSAIEKLADEYKFFAARIGSTGGTRLEVTVDGELFISAPLASLRKPWATALEAILHDEVPA